MKLGWSFALTFALSLIFCPDSVALKDGPLTGISGTVTDEGTGLGLAGIQINIRDASGSFVDADSTDASGDYQVVLDPGTYFVNTQGALGLIDEIYDDVPCTSGICDVSIGDAVVVTQDVLVTGIDFALAEGGGVSGTITDAGTGDPLANTNVQIYNDQGRFIDSIFTGVDGAYNTSAGLSSGSYFARIFNFDGYVNELYDNIVCLSCDVTSGTPVVVIAPNDTPGIDFALDFGGSISGTLTVESTGDPLAGVDLDVFDSQGNFLSVSPNPFTDLDGNYSVVGLVTGSYFVKADPSSAQGFVDELYDDIVCPSCDVTTGTPVAVVAVNNTPGIDFDLVELGSISGTVTDAVSGAPVESAGINVYSAEGNFLGGGSTAADGGYAVSGLVPGDVFVLVFSSFAEELYDDVSCPNTICDFSDGTPIAVTSGANTPNIDVVLEQDGRLFGTVTDALTGLPLAGVIVNIFDAMGKLAAVDLTTFDGSYSAFGLKVGSHFVTTTNFSGFEDELFDDLPCVAGDCDPTTGTPIPILADQTTFGVDFALGGTRIFTPLIGGPRISSRGFEPDDGSVPSLTGPMASQAFPARCPVDHLSPESEALLEGIDRLDQALRETTAAAIVPGGLSKGPWRAYLESSVQAFKDRLAKLGFAVRALEPQDAGAFLPELHGLDLRIRNLELALAAGRVPPVLAPRSALDCSSATEGVPANDDCANATVIGNGTFAGDTTQATSDGDASCGGSTGAPDIWFRYVVPADGEINVNTRGSNFSAVLSVHTGCPGTVVNEIGCNDFTFSGGASSVNLGFVTAGSEFWIRVSGSFGAAGSVNLNVGPATGISGTVTDESSGLPLAGIFMNVRDQNGFFVAFVNTDGLGDYQIAGMDPGNYFVNTNSEIGLIDEIYDDVPCPGGSCGVSIGDPITVNQDVLTTGTDFALGLGGRISGTITDASTGGPLGDTSVNVYDEQGRFVDSGFAGADGNYTTSTGLPTGTYFAWADNFTGFIDEIYDDMVCVGCDPITGTPIAVTAPSETSGIDFALDPGASISGTVTEDSTGDPVTSVAVQVYDAQGNFAASDFTDDGNYSVIGLPTGSYVARTFNFVGLIDELYDDILCISCDPIAGTPIAVTAPSETSGIDFALLEPGSISGTVTDAVTGDPVELVGINAYDFQGNFLSSTSTAADGTYTVSDVAPIDVVALAFSGFTDELYDDVACPNRTCNLSDGTPIVVASGADTPGIDFSLEQDGFISGTVTDAVTGLSLAGVIVNIFDAAGTLVFADVTSFDGFYFAFGLPAGSYFATTTNFRGLADELFDDRPCLRGSCDPMVGTPVPVVANQFTDGVDFGLRVSFIFADGFESGDTSAWSSVVP